MLCIFIGLNLMYNLFIKCYDSIILTKIIISIDDVNDFTKSTRK